MITPSKTGFASVNGINLYHEIYGSGAPLVLVHGGLTTIGEMQHALIQWLVGHERYWPVHQTEAMAAFLRDVYPCQEATPRQQGRTFPK